VSRFELDPEALVYDDRGLVPVVVQDEASGAVLMLAWADHEAVALTLETGQAHFFSRSRQRLWKKGETSGNVLEVVEVVADCDRDALLVQTTFRVQHVQGGFGIFTVLLLQGPLFVTQFLSIHCRVSFADGRRAPNQAARSHPVMDSGT